MLTIYEYPTCSTCRKAKKLLTENNIEATYFNVKEKTPTVAEFKKIIKTFDLPLKKLFNTSGLVYKELGLKDKLETLSLDEALTLLHENGMLIKRPSIWFKKWYPTSWIQRRYLGKSSFIINFIKFSIDIYLK